MSRTQRYVITIILSGLTYLFIILMPTVDPIILKKNLNLFPVNIGKWTSLGMLGPIEDLPAHADQYLYKEYTNEQGVSLFLYIGYWGKFRYESNVFSGSHLSPGFMWDPVSEKNHFIKVNGVKIPVKQIVFANGDYRISLVYWYHTNQGVTTKRFKERLVNGINAIFNRKTNVALVKIITGPYLNNKPAHNVSDQIEFTEKIFPRLTDFLPFVR